MSDIFFEENNTKEYKHKILVWPNITKLSDLSKDSYVVVLKEVINVLNKIRNDVHWTIVSPSFINDLKFENTRQIFYKVPSYPNSMRCHFNVNEVENILDLRKNDFDILYSHLPEHTLQLSNIIYNSTNVKPKIIGYCHWYEVEENAPYEKTMLSSNLFGTLEMEECGVNSVWLKNRILKESEKLLSKENVEKLNKIIQPHYLGTNACFEDTPLHTIPKSILFNSRPNKYTGWLPFLKVMDELWNKRQDFKVYMTFDCMESRPYLNKLRLNKIEYLKFIKQVHIGVGFFKGYSAWSLSVMDGLSRGLPYLLPNELCYPEMVGDNYPLLFNDDKNFLYKLESALDDPNFKHQYIDNLKTICSKYKWDNVVSKWFNNWNIFDNYSKMKNSDAYPKILEFIKKKGFATKNQITEEMGWGKSIGFSQYRNMLRDEPSIKLEIDGYRFIS